MFRLELTLVIDTWFCSRSNFNLNFFNLKIINKKLICLLIDSNSDHFKYTATTLYISLIVYLNWTEPNSPCRLYICDIINNFIFECDIFKMCARSNESKWLISNCNLDLKDFFFLVLVLPSNLTFFDLEKAMEFFLI